MARQGGQDRGAQRNADDAERQLVPAVGHRHVGEAAVGQGAEEGEVDEAADLVDPGAEHGRNDQHAHLLDALRDLRGEARDPEACAAHEPVKPQQLQQSADRHPDGKADAGRRARRLARRLHRAPRQRGQQADVEQDRRRRRRREARQRIEDRRHQRRKAHEHEIGEGDPAHGDRKVIGRRIAAQFLVGEGPQHPRHGEHHHRAEQHEDRQQHRENLARKPARGAFVLGHVAVEQRDEGTCEGALGEQAAEQVGELERELPGIRHPACAEHAGEQDVAGKAEQSADQRQPANRADIPEKAHALPPPLARIRRCP